MRGRMLTIKTLDGRNVPALVGYLVLEKEDAVLQLKPYVGTHDKLRCKKLRPVVTYIYRQAGVSVKISFVSPPRRMCVDQSSFVQGNGSNGNELYIQEDKVSGGARRKKILQQLHAYIQAFAASTASIEFGPPPNFIPELLYFFDRRKKK